VRRLAALCVLVLVLGVAAAGCTSDSTPSPPVEAAGPQTAALDWSEHVVDSDATLIFGVRELRVVDGGWEADVSIENRTAAKYEIPAASESSDRAFGLMLFEDGSIETLDDLTRRETPPPVRGAQTVEPATPLILMPGARWAGTMAARGALPVGAWVRVSFGPLTPVDDPPAGVPKGTFTWITDHAYQLR